MKPENEIKKMLKTHMKVDGNVYLTQRFFMAKSALLWALQNNKEPGTVAYYIKEIEKHLAGDITLFWEDGKIKIRKANKD